MFTSGYSPANIGSDTYIVQGKMGEYVYWQHKSNRLILYETDRSSNKAFSYNKSNSNEAWDILFPERNRKRNFCGC